jgi:hypothetical protein
VPSHEFTELTKPSPILLNELIRGATKGFTTFHRKDADGRFQGVASVPVNCFPTIWDELTQDLLTDSFCSLNLMYRRGHGYARPGLVDHNGDPLHKPHRDKQSLARLNAVWTDIDCYTRGLTEGEVIGQLWDAQKDGLIPPPSAIQSSGRGLWVFWFLHDCRAWPEVIDLWNGVMRHVQTQLSPIGADANAIDSARICRVPGSTHSKADKRVNVAILSGPNGVPRYDLAELATWFGLQHKAKRKATDAPKKASNQQKGHRGQAARWKLDEDRFWSLVSIRGGVRVGTRHAHCFVLGCILSQRYRDLELRAAQVNEQADRLWAAFLDRKEYTQRLVEREVQRAAFGNGGKPMKIAHDTIAQRLLITEAEALAIAERTGRLITQSWPTKNGPIEVTIPLTRSQRAERRQQWIRDHEQFARRATVRELADALTTAGMECSPTTADKDRTIALGPIEPTTPSMF